MPQWCHLLFLGALLVSVAPFLHLDDPFTSDEGAYAVQVRGLRAGDWDVGYAAGRYDPDGRWFPQINSVRSAKGYYTYVKHPAYPMALLASVRLAGETAGLHLLGLIGALGAAAAAWALAEEIDAGSGRGAFWLLAASPIAVNAYVVWAHAPSAAVSGWAAVAAVRWVRGGGTWYPLVMVASVVAGTLLRAEGLLFALALTMVLAGGVVRRRRWAQAALPAALLVAAAATAWAEQRWTSAIVGGDYLPGGFRDEVSTGASNGIVDLVSGRLAGAWHSLLQGSYNEPVAGAIAAVALALVAFAGWSARRRGPDWRRDVQVVLAAAAVLYAVRLVLAPRDAVTGLLATWPVVVIGLALVPLRWLDPAKLLFALTSVFALAVVATQYRFGGGLEWGGRFFFPVLVPLAVLAGAGLRRLPDAVDRRRGPLTGALVTLALIPVVTGLVVLRSTRPLLGRVVDEVAASGARVVVTDSPALPRAAWRTYPELAWMLVPGKEMAAAAQQLRDGGATRVVVVDALAPADVVTAAFPGAEEITGTGARRLGWRTFAVSAAAG